MGLYAAGTAAMMTLNNRRHEIIESMPDIDARRIDKEVNIVFARKEFNCENRFLPSKFYFIFAQQLFPTEKFSFDMRLVAW